VERWQIRERWRSSTGGKQPPDLTDGQWDHGSSDGDLLGVKANARTGRGAAAAAIGRPVDVLQMPDGSVLISDDSDNRLIRVSYSR
jgi:glucose/arabinose dehydrogenase